MAEIDRINEVVMVLIRDKKIHNKQHLADNLGYDKSKLSRILSGKGGDSQQFVADLCKLYGVNYTWIHEGRDPMFTSEETNQNSNQPEPASIPLLPISAMAGTLNDFIVTVKGLEVEYIISPIKGADFAIRVSGESMAPEYANGSQVLIKKVNEKVFIEWGSVYVLDTRNGIVIKKIVPSAKDGFVKCLSINLDPVYSPFEVSMDDIYGFYKVMLCMSLK